MFRNVRQTSSDALVVQDHPKIVDSHCPTNDIATVLRVKAVINLALPFLHSTCGWPHCINRRNWDFIIIFIINWAAQYRFVIISVECGAVECGANFQAVSSCQKEYFYRGYVQQGYVQKYTEENHRVRRKLGTYNQWPVQTCTLEYLVPLQTSSGPAFS